MATQPIRNRKTGQFTGSIGVGKHKIPTPGKPNFRSGSTQPPTREEQNIMLALTDERVFSSQAKDRNAAAREKPISRNVAEQLMNDPEFMVKVALIRNETLPKDLLLELSFSSDPNLRMVAVETERLPVARMIELADDNHSDVRSSVAFHTSSPKLLEQLSYDPSQYVVQAVTENSRTSKTVFERLKSHPNETVRQAVGRSYKTPPSVLKELSKDKNRWVRLTVANNRRTPPAVLAALASNLEEENDIRTTAGDNPNLVNRISQKLFAADFGSIK